MYIGINPDNNTLALNGLAAATVYMGGAPEIERARKRLSDLMMFGLVSELEKQTILNLLSVGSPQDIKNALAIIEEKEARALSKKPKQKTVTGKISSFVSNLSLPAGLGPKDELIQGVPNLILYGIGGVFALLTVRSVFRKRGK